MGSAHKLDEFLNTSSFNFDNEDATVNNYTELAQAVKNSPGFAHFKITLDEHKIQLSYEGLNIYLLNTTVWHNKNLFTDYLKLSEEIENTILCLGTDADFSQREDHFLNSPVDFLFIPTNL